MTWPLSVTRRELKGRQLSLPQFVDANENAIKVQHDGEDRPQKQDKRRILSILAQSMKHTLGINLKPTDCEEKKPNKVKIKMI
jgi:hypothetical protein